MAKQKQGLLLPLFHKFLRSKQLSFCLSYSAFNTMLSIEQNIYPLNSQWTIDSGLGLKGAKYSNIKKRKMDAHSLFFCPTSVPLNVYQGFRVNWINYLSV